MDRTERLNVRIAPEEMAMLEALAEQAGVSASDVVRMLIRREHEDQIEGPIEKRRSKKLAKP